MAGEPEEWQYEIPYWMVGMRLASLLFIAFVLGARYG